jgi:SAM-dependent methyltransferase
MCGGTNHRTVFRENGIDILRCQRCQHTFSSFAADPYYAGFWGEGIDGAPSPYWSVARRRMHLDFANRFLAGRGGRLLDMGCGLGFFLRAVSAYPAWERHGCEISPAAARYAVERLGQNVICARLEATNLPPDSFDLITLWDVLEHLIRPDPVLRHCHALLRDGGVCFVRSPNIGVQLPRARILQLLPIKPPTVGYLQPRDHLHHYSMASLRHLLERNGFSDIEFVHLHPIDSEGVVGRVKVGAYRVVRALVEITGGRVNLDNLFAVARKKRPLG